MTGRKKSRMTKADLFSDLLIDSQRFETIPREDDLVAFVGQHLRRELGNLGFIIDQ